MYFQPGDTVGDYEILGVLGEGGMGKVYKVRNVISDRVEAMKVLLPDLHGDPELADRFLREIKVQASLDHPNIAALRTALRAENQLIMVMEFVEGRTLVDLLEQGPIPLRAGIEYMCQALSALAYAHERGVIHRDIKPANIMLANDGVIKLMDFGIAKAAADRKLTMTGTTMGSLYYMSPEQVKGTTALDARSDLYSLGITLYEVVTGTRPFKGDSDYAIMSAHLEKAPVPPIEVHPNLPGALNEIILKSIAKDPADRFQNANAFRTALKSVQAELVPEAPAFPEAQPQAARAGAAPTPRLHTAPPVSPPTPHEAIPAAPRGSPPAARRSAPIPPAPSRRGLYMLAGGVLTLVLLIAAGIEVANWRKTRAGADQPSSGQPANATGNRPEASTPGVSPATNPTDPAQAETTLAAPAGQSAAAEVTGAALAGSGGRNPSAHGDVGSSAAPSPGLQRGMLPPEPSRTGQAVLGNTPQQVPRQPANRTPPAAPTNPVSTSPAAPPPAVPADAAAQASEAQQLRERMIDLAARANAVKASMDGIERQQRASGLSMRADMAAAAQRVQFLMGEANGALAARDNAAAKRNMDLAERDIEKLEAFLGR